GHKAPGIAKLPTHQGDRVRHKPASMTATMAAWVRRSRPATRPITPANGTNNNQLGRINVASPAATPPANDQPKTPRVAFARQASVQKIKFKSISGVNGASLSMKTLSAIASG